MDDDCNTDEGPEEWTYLENQRGELVDRQEETKLKSTRGIQICKEGEHLTMDGSRGLRAKGQ